MDQLDRLSEVATVFRNERNMQLVKEVARLREETIDNYFLCSFLEEGAHITSHTIVKAKNKEEVVKKLVSAGYMNGLFKDLNEDLISDDEDPIESLEIFIKDKIELDEISVTGLEFIILGEGYLNLDPGHLNSRERKGTLYNN